MLFWIKLKIHLYVLRTFLSLISTYLSRNKLKRNYFFQRLGFYGEGKKEKSLVVFSNAGEITGTNEFLRRLKKEYSDCKLIVAVENFDTMNIAKNSITVADNFVYFPHDVTYTINKFLKYTNPKLILFLYALFRSEIINQCSALGIKIGVINGYFREQLLAKKGARECLLLMKNQDVFNKLDFYAMQTKEDYDKISEFVNDKSKIYLSGFLKFDLSYAFVNKQEKKELENDYFISDKDLVLIAGATNFDEEIILDAHKKISSVISNVKLLIVPRHLERVNEIEEIIKSRNFVCTKKSKLTSDFSNYQVLLVDTEINLAKLYSLGDINILGRSFVPYEKIKQGGSNIFEAAIHGKPLFFGTNMTSWKEYSSKVLDSFPQTEAKDSDDLAEKIIRVLKNRLEYLKLGKFMKKFVQKEVIEKQKNVIENYLKIVRKHL